MELVSCWFRRQRWAPAPAAAAAGPAAKLALFLPESRRDGAGFLLVQKATLGTSSSSTTTSSSSRASSCKQQAQLCFYQNPERTSSPGTACFWRSFRPSGPWCFPVSQPPAKILLWSCFEGMGAALWSWFLVGSEGNVRHQLQQQQQQAQQLNSLCFYQIPEGTSSPGTACFWRSFRPSGPWCFAVSQPPANILLWSCFEGIGAALWS